MKRKFLAVFLIFMFMGGIISCGSWQTVKERPFDTWSSKKKLTYVIKVYNSEYDKYMIAATRPDLSASQVDYLKNKREALIALDSIIQTLIPIADVNGQIPANMESQLILLLNTMGVFPM